MTAKTQVMNWDDLRVFLELARSDSLVRAARHLGVNATTVSRRISALEESLGMPLFERSTQGWSITPLGERLVAEADRMADQAHAISRLALSDSQELRGKLRVTLADVCTQRLALPAIKEFSAQYPEVEIEVIATMNELDLAARQADIALRVTDDPPDNLVGTRVATMAYGIYGNRDWLKWVEAGDRRPICLTWLGDGKIRPPWIEQNFPGARRVDRTNSLMMVLHMLNAGLGIAQIPCPLGDAEPGLVRIPVDYVEPGWGLWVLSHVDLRTTARLRLFREMLLDVLGRQQDRIEGRVPAMDSSA